MEGSDPGVSPVIKFSHINGLKRVRVNAFFIAFSGQTAQRVSPAAALHAL